MSRTALRTVGATGDAYTIGRVLGEVAAAALRDVVFGIDRFGTLTRDWCGTDRLRSLEAAARAACPQYVREIEGMADGAGVEFETLFLWNCRGDLPETEGSTTAEAGVGCTTLMVPAQGPHPGMIAHNEDDVPELHGHCHLVDVQPDEAPGFLSFYSPGLLPGHSFAVNRAGLVQTVDDVRPLDRRIGTPRHFLCRAVLDCERLDDAVACIGASDRASGFHHTLGCAGDHRLLSVEAPAGGCAVAEVNAPRVHANHLLDPRLARTPQVIAPSSRSRQRRAETLMRCGAVDAVDPLRVLGDVGSPLPIHRRENDAGDPGFTLATAVFRIGDAGVEFEVFDDLRRPAEYRGTVCAEPARR